MVEKGYLLDTNVASAANYANSAEHNKVQNWLGTLGSNDITYISAVSLAEIEYGLNLKPLSARDKAKVRSLLAPYEILEIDRHTAKVYGEIRADIFNKYSPRNKRGRVKKKYVEDLLERTSGKSLGIQENDLWIVSVAVQHNMEFVTFEKRGKIGKIVDIANYDQRTIYLT